MPFDSEWHCLGWVSQSRLGGVFRHAKRRTETAARTRTPPNTMAEWYVIRGAEERGPYDDAKLKQLATSGRLRQDDKIRRSDSAATHLAQDVRGLFAVEMPPLAVPETSRPTPPPTTPAASAKPTVAQNWKAMPLWKKALAIGGICIPLMNGMRGCAQAGGGVGRITFAEKIDPQTMETFREGTRFRPGWVNLIVRAGRPFGDTKVIIYGRAHEEQQWRVIKEETVDAEWDTVALPFMLGDAGKYDVKATTSKGKLLAQSVVEIVE